MPRKLPRACQQVGCPTLTLTTYCEDCAAKRLKHANRELRERVQSDPQMRSDRAFYKSPEWRSFAAKVLATSPTCRVCGEPARVVDHIRTLRDGAARLDPANIQTLCDRCHNSKRGYESQRAQGFYVDYPAHLLPRHLRK